MTLRQASHDAAEVWVRFARDPGADRTFWSWHLQAFLTFIPDPGQLTVDIGCGEGRLGREMARDGHRVVGLDPSTRLVHAAAQHPAAAPVLVADAARLPFCGAIADLVVLFMVLHDVDDLATTVGEAARVLEPGGRLALAIGHPIQGIGDFSGDDRSGPYVLARPYFEPRRLTYWWEGNGVRVPMHFLHRPLESFFAAITAAGLLVESLAEPSPLATAAALSADDERRRQVPSFVHIRALKPS